MKWALFFVVGFGSLAGLLGWWFWTIATTRERVQTYCQTTRRGQPWTQAKDRAEEKGLEIVGYGGSDMLVFEQAIDKRFGCVVVVTKEGMVLESRFAELPGK